MYGPPDTEGLQVSQETYYTAKHHSDDAIHIIDVYSIESVVVMASDHRYPGGIDVGYWYMYEKVGLKVIQRLGDDLNPEEMNRDS